MSYNKTLNEEAKNLYTEFAKFSNPKMDKMSDEERLAWERLKKLDSNVRTKIENYKDYIFEAEAMYKNVAFIKKEWLEETISIYERKIRDLEGLYR